MSYTANRVRNLQKTEPRKWHQKIKSMLNTNKTELDMHIPGVDRANHKDMANAINLKFVGVSSHINPLDTTKLPAFLPASKPAPMLYPWEVYEELRKVKISKSSGPDGISPKLIKEFAYELSGPLTDVLNCSFEEGVVPSQWKSAIVVPVPKQFPPKVDKMRPISLTDIFAKIAEGFVAKWVVQDIENNIDVNQFGNVQGVSTSHYLMSLLHHLHQGSDKSYNIGTVVLTDFSKAFDLVNHNIAIEKLSALGVRGAIVPWICSFLNNRRQCVRYNQTLSDYAVLTAGVPQGTKLGPITFQIVINDAACNSNTSCWKYVDDLTFAENRLCKEDSKMQADLDDFLEWSETNQLKLNPTKCQAIQICFMRNPPPHLDLKIGTKSLSFVSSAKVLGIWLQEDLKWDSQIDPCKNANKRLFMLRTLKRFGFNTSELITVYRGYIRPIIEYADVIWHSSLTLKQSQTLESIQRRACKIMLGFEYVSYVNALEICDLDLLSARRETHCLNFARSLLKSERTKMLIPPADRRFMANSLEIAPTSPNYVRALTDSLKAPFPTTLACLIPPSLPLGGSCVAPTFGVVIGFLFCLPLLTFCCLYIVLFLCLFV